MMLYQDWPLLPPLVEQRNNREELHQEHLGIVELMASSESEMNPSRGHATLSLCLLSFPSSFSSFIYSFFPLLPPLFSPSFPFPSLLFLSLPFHSFPFSSIFLSPLSFSFLLPLFLCEKPSSCQALCCLEGVTL